MTERTESLAPQPIARPIGRDEVIESTIRAAADLFSEHNPSQVSVRDIAARAGVSHALVHRYLGSKRNIFARALEQLREEAGRFWAKSPGDMDASFAPDLPPGRYVRAVLRATLDNELPIPVEALRLPRAERMVEFMASTPLHVDDRPFDPRLLLAATMALSVGMSLARDFFLEQGGIEGEARDAAVPELSRLVLRMLSLADMSDLAAADREAS